MLFSFFLHLFLMRRVKMVDSETGSSFGAIWIFSRLSWFVPHLKKKVGSPHSQDPTFPLSGFTRLSLLHCGLVSGCKVLYGMPEIWLEGPDFQRIMKVPRDGTILVTSYEVFVRRRIDVFSQKLRNSLFDYAFPVQKCVFPEDNGKVFCVESKPFFLMWKRWFPHYISKSQSCTFIIFLENLKKK